MMRSIAYLGLLLGIAAPAYAQATATGTWRVAEATPPATLVLRVDGSILNGTIRIGAIGAINDGRVDGHTITFQVTRPAGDLTLSLIGSLNGDEIAFTREIHRVAGAISPPNPNLRLEALPGTFTARRVADTGLTDQDKQQIETTDQPRGIEVSAAANFIQDDFKAVGTLFIPQKTKRVSALIVVVHYGLGQVFFWDSELRRAAESHDTAVLLVGFPSMSTPGGGTRPPSRGGSKGLLVLLQRLADETARAELLQVPLLFWGHSAAGSVATAFAALFPERTIAFVRYNSGPVAGADVNGLIPVPGLLMAAGQDSIGTINAAETLWKSGRGGGAPWTFALLPKARHGNEDDLRSANGLMIPWITALIHARVSQGAGPLRAVADGAWLGDVRSQEVALEQRYEGQKLHAAWLPDESTARAWRVVVSEGK